MSFTVECGYCHQVVAIPADAIGQCVTCPTCGWMLAVVVAVPVTSPPTAPTPSRPNPRPAEPLLGDYPPQLRARYLTGQWASVLRGLIIVKWVTLSAILLYPVWAVMALTLMGGRGREEVDRAVGLSMVGTVCALIIHVLHLIGQAYAAAAPRESGGRLVRVSLSLGCSAIAAGVILFVVSHLAALLVYALVMVVGSGVWLVSLGRLGDGLGDPRLASRAASYYSKYVAYIVLSLVLEGWALVGAADLTFFGAVQLLLCGLSLALNVAYYRLLRTAELAVAGRAPVVEDAIAQLADEKE